MPQFGGQRKRRKKVSEKESTKKVDFAGLFPKVAEIVTGEPLEKALAFLRQDTQSLDEQIGRLYCPVCGEKDENANGRRRGFRMHRGCLDAVKTTAGLESDSVAVALVIAFLKAKVQPTKPAEKPAPAAVAPRRITPHHVAVVEAARTGNGMGKTCPNCGGKKPGNRWLCAECESKLGEEMAKTVKANLKAWGEMKPASKVTCPDCQKPFTLEFVNLESGRCSHCHNLYQQGLARQARQEELQKNRRAHMEAETKRLLGWKCWYADRRIFREAEAKASNTEVNLAELEALIRKANAAGARYFARKTADWVHEAELDTDELDELGVHGKELFDRGEYLNAELTFLKLWNRAAEMLVPVRMAELEERRVLKIVGGGYQLLNPDYEEALTAYDLASDETNPRWTAALRALDKAIDRAKLVASQIAFSYRLECLPRSVAPQLRDGLKAEAEKARVYRDMIGLWTRLEEAEKKAEAATAPQSKAPSHAGANAAKAQARVVVKTLGLVTPGLGHTVATAEPPTPVTATTPAEREKKARQKGNGRNGNRRPTETRVINGISVTGTAEKLDELKRMFTQEPKAETETIPTPTDDDGDGTEEVVDAESSLPVAVNGGEAERSGNGRRQRRPRRAEKAEEEMEALGGV